MRTNYSIAFVKPTAAITSPNTIAVGSLTFANALHSTDDLYWGQNILGELVFGSYKEVFMTLENFKESPNFIIIFAKKIIGLEVFLESLNVNFPGIPVIGGVSAQDANGNTFLYPSNDADIMLLLAYDDRYICGNINAYPEVIDEVEVRSSKKNFIEEIKYRNNWMNAADVYRELQNKYGIDPTNFESIVLSDLNNRNVHSVINGNVLETTADLSGEQKVFIRKSSQEQITKHCQEIFSKPKTLFFACAGIKSMFTQEIITGEGSMAGFFYGEIGTYKNTAKLQGLSISYLTCK